MFTGQTAPPTPLTRSFTMIEQRRLETLQTRMEEAATLPPGEAIALWRHLGRQIDALCGELEKGDPAAAHATLPALSDMIARLDATIEQLTHDTTEK